MTSMSVAWVALWVTPSRVNDPRWGAGLVKIPFPRHFARKHCTELLPFESGSERERGYVGGEGEQVNVLPH